MHLHSHTEDSPPFLVNQLPLERRMVDLCKWDYIIMYLSFTPHHAEGNTHVSEHGQGKLVDLTLLHSIVLVKCR